MFNFDFTFNFTMAMTRHNIMIINSMPPMIEQLTAIVKPEIACDGGSEGLLVSIDERW